MKLHVGCGRVLLPGWTNVDLEGYPGVDHVLDVRRGLPFRDVEFVFAEHFIEHLDFDEGQRFLRDCRGVMTPAGVLRLSTPNLDWVWRHQYHRDHWSEESEAVRDCFWMNKAFRGWGHRFIYNRQTLAQALLQAGFASVEETSYGESRHPELRGLEHHETYPDTRDSPHVIVLEAAGRGSAGSEMLAEPLRDYREALAIG